MSDLYNIPIPKTPLVVTPTKLLDQDLVLFAARNQYHRWFIPSSKNEVDGLELPFFMIDSGCNTVLLMIPDGKVDNMEILFPLKDHQWSFKTGGGISAVPSLNLVIQSLIPKPFEFKFATDLGGFSFSENNPLRFHLSWEDAEYFKNNLSQLNLPPDHVKDLNSFIAIGNTLKKDNIDIGKKRDHCLFGQNIIKLYNTVQLGDEFWFMFSKKSTIDDNLLLKYRTPVNDFVTENLVATKNPGFFTLEDDDHAQYDQYFDADILMDSNNDRF